LLTSEVQGRLFFLGWEKEKEAKLSCAEENENHLLAKSIH